MFAISFLLSATATHAIEETTVPAAIPIVIKQDGDPFTTRIRVDRDRYYTVALSIFYLPDDRIDRERLIGFPVGDAYEIKVHLEIRGTNVKDRFFLEVENVPQTTEIGSAYASKRVAAVILKPGTYDVEVRSMTASAELKGRKMALAIGYPKM